MVFDHTGQHLYITTSDGFVQSYNLASGTFDASYDLGGSLNGLDIAPDDSFLLVCQNLTSSSQGTVHKLDLASGTVTNINYPKQYTDEAGAWNVVICSNGLALFTTDASIKVPLREINLLTNTVKIRNDVPSSDGYSNQVYRQTEIHRSADRTRLYFRQSYFSGAIFSYNALTNSFGPLFQTDSYTTYASAAVNRDGSLAANRVTGAALDTMPDFNFVHSFGPPDSGVAFDATTDILYAVSSATSQIIAYDTNTFAERFRLAIGSTVGQRATQFGSGNLIASPSGCYLALETTSGVEVIPVPKPFPDPTPTPAPLLGKARDMVFDHQSHYLYIATAEGFVFPYNIGTDTLEAPYDLGGLLQGIDIAADDSCLLVAQAMTGMTQGMFQKIDLKTGTVTNINYLRGGSETGGWAVAIASNGLAFVTTGYSWTPLRQIDLATNTITIRTDDPETARYRSLSGTTEIIPSLTGTRLYFFDYGVIPGGLFAYDAASDSFGPLIPAQFSGGMNSVNRDATLLAVRPYPNPTSLESLTNYSLIHGFANVDGGFAFDAVRDIFYGVNSLTDQIVAFDTNTYSESFRFDVGEYVNGVTGQLGPGRFVASRDGRYLALITPTTVRVYAVPAVQLVRVTSQKTHGNAGTFDLDLPLDSLRPVECRSGGANGEYKLIFTFGLPLAHVGGAVVSSGVGSVASSAIDDTDNHRYIVNLTGVSNAQFIKVTLNDLTDSAGNHTVAVSQQMGVLIGDTNADGFVDSIDASQTKSQSGNPVSASNFREDINLDGFIDSIDAAFVKSKSGTSLSAFGSMSSIAKPSHNIPLKGLDRRNHRN